jgi:hypothetical protein
MFLLMADVKSYVGQYISFLVLGRVTRSLLLSQVCAQNVTYNPFPAGRMITSWQISEFV